MSYQLNINARLLRQKPSHTLTYFDPPPNCKTTNFNKTEMDFHEHFK